MNILLERIFENRESICKVFLGPDADPEQLTIKSFNFTQSDDHKIGGGVSILKIQSKKLNSSEMTKEAKIVYKNSNIKLDYIITGDVNSVRKAL